MSSKDTHFDIVIIGAGAAGLSVGYFLAPQANIAVLEREEQPAYHSSGRSAAMYIESYENEIVQDLTRAGKAFFFTPPNGFAQSPLVSPAGGMTVAGPGQDAALDDYWRAWRPTCPDMVRLSPNQAHEMVPILRKDWLRGTVYDPSWHSIDVHELLSGYQRGIRANGGEILTNHGVTAISRANDEWQITAGEQTVRANILINAAGAWAPQVGELAGLNARPMTPLRRTALIVPGPDDLVGWPLVHTIDENLYFKPESPGLMMSPQDETPSEAMDAFPLELDVALAIDRFARIANHPVKRVMHQWAGLRTFTPDHKPIVGFDDQAPEFFWLAGQGGFGIQTSPGLGQLAAEVVLQRTTSPASLDANRFN